MTTTPDLWRSPFTDNTSLTGQQDSGVVAPTAGDQFFAVWVDRTNFGPFPGTDAIIARKFDSLGNPLTGEVALHFFGPNEDQPAAVALPIAGQADGLAVALTITSDQLNTFNDVWLLRTNAALVDLAPNPIPIDVGLNNVDHPSITSFSDGSVWVSYTLHLNATDSLILAKHVDAAGNVSAPITISPPFPGADNSDLATLVNGNVVAVFEARPTPFDHDIFFTIKTETLTDVVSPTPVFGANDPRINENDAHVAALADGGFVVTWTDEAGDTNGTSNGIRASVYDADGGLVQGNILVNAFHQAGGQFFSDVTGLPDGGFIVTWEDDAGLVERSQRFDEAGNLVGTDFSFPSVVLNNQIHTNAATLSDGRAILTTNVDSTGVDVATSIWDSRITDANQVTGANFFGPTGDTAAADLFLIRDIGGVRQLEAVTNDGTATVFDPVATNQNFVGSGDFNGDRLSDLLINVDSGTTRTFLVDQMNPDGIQAQFQIAVRGSDWIVDATADFNQDGTSDILEHRDTGGQRTLEVSVMNNNVVQSNITIGVNGTNWDVDGTGDFNHDGTSDILQHRIDLSNGSMNREAGGGAE